MSRYPFISHAFILREIQGLRALGTDVVPFTVVRVPEAELIEDETRAEDARTIALRPIGAATLGAVLARAALRRPRGFVAAFARAWSLRAGGVRDLVWQLAYAAQGVLLARRMAGLGLTHVHAHHANVASDVALYACTYDPSRTWSLTLHGPTELNDVATHRLGVKLADAARVACISDFARSQALAQLPYADWDRLEVVHLGVDLDAFAPVDRSGRSGLHVLSVGRLAEQKGQPLLLEAIALAREAGADVRLTLVGDGPLRDVVARRRAELGLEDVVDLPGAVGHDRIGALYAAADAFALSSFAEGVPVVLMEAMACELPVVAPRIMGIPELVADGVSGLLVPPARADRLAAALVHLAGLSADERAALGRAGRAAVAEGYELGASARAMRNLLGEAAGSGRLSRR